MRAPTRHGPTTARIVWHRAGRWCGGAAHDKVGWDNQFPIDDRGAVEPGDRAGDRESGDLLRVLGHGGEGDVRQVREAAVVEPDDGHVIGNPESGPPEDIEGTGCATVVEHGDGGRSGIRAEEDLRGRGSVVLG